MYCAQCGEHFTGFAGDGRCPSCQNQQGDWVPDSAVTTAIGDREPSAGSRMRGRSGWSPGTLVASKYEIVAPLGSGGFGSVYKVRHVFRKKYYALKVPHAQFVEDDTFRLRFEREIEVIERFVHPDVVTVRDSGVAADGTPYYTMDFVEGETLRRTLDREKRFELSRAITLVGSILKTLDAAHARQIIHRDIKPDNFLVTEEAGRERVRVLDFGMSKLLDLAIDSQSITRSACVGTPNYMSPEQIAGDSVDVQSNLFSLGIMFYEMVTGKHPFVEVNDPIRASAAILRREPVPPCELVENVSRRTSDLILSLIDQSPKRRPRSARAVLSLLAPLRQPTLESVSPARAFSLRSEFTRAPAEPLVLEQQTSNGERRCFLLFDDHVSIGRSQAPESERHRHLITRCLPCRSREQDPENWGKNRTISHLVASIRPESNALVLTPSESGGHGVRIGGARTVQPAWIRAERFSVAIGERVLELDGHQVVRTKRSSGWDLRLLDSGRPETYISPGIGYSNPSCLIDCVSLKRANNWPLHEYYLVYRFLRIGSSANATLQFHGGGVRSLHAAIIQERGEVFLTPLGGPVRVLIPASRGIGSALQVGPGQLMPLTPGLRLFFGDALVAVKALDHSAFKKV